MVAVTHGDRVLYPADGWTKADVVAHYGAVAPAMLPHLRDRPLTLVRYHRGIDEAGFFQKHTPEHAPAFIRRIAVARPGGTTLHAAVDDAEGLQYLANQGAIEIHTALVTADALDRPDRLVVDLDPPDGDPGAVRAAARRVRALLDELGAPSTPVASGGKGYHVHVALVPDADAHAIAHAALVIANALAQRWPDELTIETLKKNRRGRIYVDWLRNTWGATVIAPYSLRARPHAPVAMPITWDELDAIAPAGITIASVAARIGADDPLLTLARAPVGARELCARIEALRATLTAPLVRYDRFGRAVAVDDG